MDLPPLSSDAQAALGRARGVAAERGLNRADLGDILMALIETEQAVAVLDLFEAEPEKVRAAVAILSGGTWQTDPSAEDHTVALARAEAARLGQTEAGSEHLLLALARQSGSLPAAILESLGLTLDPAREAVRFRHGQVPDWQPPTSLASSAASSWAPMDFVPGSISEAEAARMLEAAMSNFEVGMSALDRSLASARPPVSRASW